MKELKGEETLKPGDDEQYSNCNIMLQTLNGDSSTRHQQQIPGAHVNVTSLQVNLISTHSIRDEQLQNTHKKSILRLFLHAQWSTYIGYMHILLHNMTNSICASYAYILHVHTYILYTVYVCNVLHVHVRMTSIFTVLTRVSAPGRVLWNFSKVGRGRLREWGALNDIRVSAPPLQPQNHI